MKKNLIGAFICCLVLGGAMNVSAATRTILADDSAATATQDQGTANSLPTTTDSTPVDQSGMNNSADQSQLPDDQSAKDQSQLPDGQSQPTAGQEDSTYDDNMDQDQDQGDQSSSQEDPSAYDSGDDDASED